MTVTPEAPTLADVLAARRRIAPHLRPTALHRYPALDAVAGTSVWVKHENHQPVGAFKVRGGVNLMACLDEGTKARGVISASTGNHGQSVAYAAQLFGVRAVVCVPATANPAKVESMRALGAEVILHGVDFDEAREHCEGLAAERGMRYVHSGDEPLLIAGVATGTLEIFEDLPDVDVIVVPVGGGSGAAGACVVAQAMNSRVGGLGGSSPRSNSAVQVIGVQSSAAPAAYHSWQARELRTDRMETFAEGLATRTAFAVPQSILWHGLHDFVLVSDDQLRAATRLLIAKTRNLVEPAGAAVLAAVLADPDRFAGRRVAVVCSGGNISVDQLRDLLLAPDPTNQDRLG